MKTNRFYYAIKVLLSYSLVLLLWTATALSQQVPEPIFSCEETFSPRKGKSTGKAFVDLEYNGQLGPDHGRFYSVAFDPLSEGVIYAANMNGRQLFVSTDNGASWTHIFSIPQLEPGIFQEIRDVRFANPQEPTHLYLQIKNWKASDTSNRGLHIIDVSTQEVVKQMSIQEDGTFLNIEQYAVYQPDPDYVLAITVSNKHMSRRDVWISNNGGKHFKKIYDHLDHLDVSANAVVFHPDDPNTIFVGRRTLPHMPSSGGIYVSTNGGETWETSGLLNIPIGEIIFPEGQSKKAYAITGWGSDKPALYLSNDEGMTWREVAIDYEFEGKTNYFARLLINPHDHDNIFITHTRYILITRDAGETWEISSFSGEQEKYSYGFDVEMDPFDDSHFVICNDLRVIRSTDAGKSWKPIANKNTVLTHVEAVAFPNNERYLYYEADASYFSHNLETGEINGKWSIGALRAKHVFADPYTQDRAFVAKPCYGFRCVSIYKSDDNFLSEPELLYHDEQSHLLQNIFRDPHDEETYWLFLPYMNWNSYGRLLRTTDGFQSFQQLTVTGMIDVITTIQAVEGQPGVLWAYAFSGFDVGLFKSEDYGNTWRKYQNGLPEGAGIWDVAVNPNNPDNLLAAVSMDQGIYRSSDGGETWMPAFTDFECTNISFSQKHENLAFAQRIGHTDHIVYTTDGGHTWFEIPRRYLIDADYSRPQFIDNKETIDIYTVAWGMGVSHYTFTVPYFTARFHIQEEKGTNVHDAVITINNTTYEPGSYTAEKLMPQTYNFVVSQDGYEDYSGSFSIVDRSKDIYVELTPTGSVDIPLVESEAIGLFPNPASSDLTISSGEKIKHVELISLDGKVLMSEHACHAEICTLDISSYGEGMYLIVVETEINTHVKSIIIRK